MIFDDRTDAGIQLARALASYAGPDTVIYALPRGGVVPGAEVARALGAPLDLIVVRKVGHPASPEFAIAAVSDKGRIIRDEREVRAIDESWFAGEVRAQQEEAKRRRLVYLRGRRRISATDKVAIIVDDGLATGLTMKLAIEEIRAQHPRSIIVAVPVAPADTVASLRESVDAVEVIHVPGEFGAIGAFYRNFDQVRDAEVIRILDSLTDVAQNA